MMATGFRPAAFRHKRILFWLAHQRMAHMIRSKLRVSFLATAFATVFAVAFAQPQGQTMDRPAAWKSVEEAVQKGLPKTAIEKLEPIIEATLAEKAYAEAIKAISTKIALEGNIEGNRPEEKIIRMRKAIETSPDEMKPVMEAILANWFWHYFQQNRWQFLERTQTESSPGDDFTTWSLPQILAEVDNQFDKAFAHSDILKAATVESYEKLLDQPNSKEAARPTLFDVVAHNALEFYAAGEQGATKVQDAFDLSAESPVFGSREEFLAWEPTTTDSESLLLRAVQLYQELIQFHLNDEEPAALLDADLARLEFANNHANGEEKAERFKAALKRFEQANSKYVISTRAIHLLAAQIQSEGEFAEAHKIAAEGLQRFPESVGANRCYNLMKEIEAPSAVVTTERTWADPWPTIDVRYRNTNKIYLRLIRFDFDAFIRSNRWSPEHFDFNERQAITRQRPIKQWSVDLPKTDDFKERVEKIEVPKDLALGSYFLIASSDATFTDNQNQLSFAEVWVTKISLVIRSQHQNGIVEALVTDAKTGEPISGAVVKGWQRNDQGALTPLTSLRTDKNGLCTYPATNRNGLLIQAAYQGSQISSAQAISLYVSLQGQDTHEQTRFFTDRSIYRPGHTIQYKGICLSSNRTKNDYKVIAKRSLTVVFVDVNGKEIERRQHATNDYGSFSGSVTAPRDRLMGKMVLSVEGGPSGQAVFRVEEYKRPKFKVELESPKEAAKLGDEVTMTGKATAYTGVAINDAQVSWRVVREVRYPIWWAWRCWWCPPAPGESQEIAHGTSTTATDGSFSVTFTAKPNPSVDVKSEPTFEYIVYADVTDTTGETRSDDRSVNIGYTALSATMTADGWLTSEQPVKIKVTTATLDGEGMAASGTIKIHAVKQPAQVARGALNGAQPWMPTPEPKVAGGEAPVNPADPNSWPLGEVVSEQNFETDGAGNASIEAKLEAGIYRAVLSSRDAFGKEVNALLPLQVLNPKANKLNIKIADLLAIKKQTVEPGETWEAIWGSGYGTARAFIEIEHRGKRLQSYWTQPNQTQTVIKQAVTEELRGGFYVRVTMIRENRAYLHTQFIDVPWTNKKLSIKWERFVSKLTPGQKETWSAIISGPDAKRVAAEMVATLYDASLDAFDPHDWLESFGVFHRDNSWLQSSFSNMQKQLGVPFFAWQPAMRDGSLLYPRLPSTLTTNLYGYQYMRKGRMMRGAMMEDYAYSMPMSAAMPAPAGAALEGMGGMGGMVDALATAESPMQDMAGEGDQTTSNKNVDLSNVSARKNLNETAFFFPHLIAGDDGTVRVEFTMPEALTEWKFLGFAHDPELRAGLLIDKVVTSKDLMVQPNPPRFLREGDSIEFTVKVSNRSATRQTGTVRLNVSNARTNESVDAKLGNEDADKAFDIAAGESKSFAWRLSVPDGIGFLTYKAVGSTGRISDGEEGFLPVLSRRILVTESLPLPIRGKQTKTFDFTKLGASGESNTLKHQSLTVQMVSNPSWYAVMALPYLMEFPHECSEQTFNRLYANSLARHIVTSDPKIERVFAQWRGTPALDSPLDKNEDLKSVMLEETPWYRQAQDESQARRNVGVLFEQNRLDAESLRAIGKLDQAQLENGLWPWFPGGQGNEFISLYIVTGFGRLRHLGVNVDASSAIEALGALDHWVSETYQRIKPEHRDQNHLSSTIALYLYGRSFFLDDQAISPENRVAVDYFLAQGKRYWLQLNCRQSQAHLAVTFKRFGDLDSAKAIMASIKERSVSNEELGMFWRDLEDAWWWYRAPIESQAMMIEAFDEVMNDTESVEACKVWLLKQKQTQDWRTTKATADAVYALLLRGTDMLASDQLVEVSLGDTTIEPQNVEAGTGFYEERFAGGDVAASQSKITVKKVDEGVAWGSVHWQYLEDISKVTAHEGTPLKLSKELYVKKNSPKGPVLDKVTEAVAVGDELVVRVILRVDRDMEFVHLKDHRGSGTEPVNVLSQYKFQDGLAYYESTRDTASHFFIDYLPKGTYVFEYSTRVQLRGEYQTGMANIECMYAPEFNSHSESLPLIVK
jgi:uncharacterized protein YfaS (alpha-2-macroglobulin family)